MSSIKEQLEMHRKWKADPKNNPRPESLADEDYFKRGCKLPERPVQHRSKPLSVITCVDSVNGKQMDKYSWAQSHADVTVRIPVSENIKKGNQVKVEIKKRFIDVSIVGESEPLLKNWIWKDIDTKESFWTLCPGEAIDIVLVKNEPGLWDVLTPDDDEPLDMNQSDFYRNLNICPQPPPGVNTEELNQLE